MSKVAVVGLGSLGRALAAGLASSGQTVRGYSRSAVTHRVSLQGGSVVPTPRDAVAGAEVVFSCVSGDEASREVWDGPDGLFQSCDPGTVVVEMSTVNQDRARAWTVEASSRAMVPAVAPVTGGPARAKTSSLIAFAGEDQLAAPGVRTALEMVSEKIVTFPRYLDACGYKLVHNAAAASSLLALAEALRLAEGLQVPSDLALETLSTWGWLSPVAADRGPRMVGSDGSEFICSVETLGQNVRDALESVIDGGFSLPMLQAVNDVFSQAIARGFAKDDMASVIEAYR